MTDLNALAERLESIRADHLKRASVCSAKGLTKRTAFHHDAATTLTQARSALKGRDGADPGAGA